MQVDDNYGESYSANFYFWIDSCTSTGCDADNECDSFGTESLAASASSPGTYRNDACFSYFGRTTSVGNYITHYAVNSDICRLEIKDSSGKVVYYSNADDYPIYSSQQAAACKKLYRNFSCTIGSDGMCK